MTYKKAYSKLNKAGKIDEIISRFTKAGNSIEIVKYEIVNGIEYYTEFTESEMFYNMKYRQDTSFFKTEEEKLHINVTNAILKALATIEIQEATKKTEALNYLINTRKEI